MKDLNIVPHGVKEEKKYYEASGNLTQVFLLSPEKERILSIVRRGKERTQIFHLPIDYFFNYHQNKYLERTSQSLIEVGCSSSYSNPKNENSLSENTFHPVIP